MDFALSRPKVDDLPNDIRARILEVQEKAGFVPDVFIRSRIGQRSSRVQPVVMNVAA